MWVRYDSAVTPLWIRFFTPPRWEHYRLWYGVVLEQHWGHTGAALEEHWRSIVDKVGSNSKLVNSSHLAQNQSHYQDIMQENTCSTRHQLVTRSSHNISMQKCNKCVTSCWRVEVWKSQLYTSISVSSSIYCDELTSIFMTLCLSIYLWKPIWLKSCRFSPLPCL